MLHRVATHQERDNCCLPYTALHEAYGSMMQPSLAYDTSAEALCHSIPWPQGHSRACISCPWSSSQSSSPQASDNVQVAALIKATPQSTKARAQFQQMKRQQDQQPEVDVAEIKLQYRGGNLVGESVAGA